MPTKSELQALIDKAKGSKTSMEECADLLGAYIQEAENLLPELEGETEMSPSQHEIYKRLEAAVGPGSIERYFVLMKPRMGLFFFLENGAGFDKLFLLIGLCHTTEILISYGDACNASLRELWCGILFLTHYLIQCLKYRIHPI